MTRTFLALKKRGAVGVGFPEGNKGPAGTRGEAVTTRRKAFFSDSELSKGRTQKTPQRILVRGDRGGSWMGRKKLGGSCLTPLTHLLTGSVPIGVSVNRL